jgi:hypothetical protein
LPPEVFAQMDQGPAFDIGDVDRSATASGGDFHSGEFLPWPGNLTKQVQARVNRSVFDFFGGFRYRRRAVNYLAAFPATDNYIEF